ncbi:MAG TPA: DNA polymerase III subunit gamma/tau, partial [Chromatiaceae bacterium]|nr:DNA polymerase III subunit gamma/tau [Chromatiaceae bacterium]
MSYQVLARKWRPRSFADMVGQAHVVRALSNALDQDRLHHAYLFTGTRGVGKTTLARILAKALNCEAGVSSTPCCQCPSCREIDEGRFVDLLEVDAASRTRVDQTRDLLDNVPFAPVKGRFKVYLIDEVHMFSTSSFNALLKTLEEPPPHVKFLLATTDPQKVPVTVLSRCLQFNLKRLVPEEIATQLAHILTVEAVPFEAPALALLARAADGSMRDGLSLLDQAIAFGGGRVGAEDIRAMLGTVGRDMSLRLLQALAARDGAALLAEVARIHELAPDFGGVLQEVLGLLHRLALFQQVPVTLAADDPEREALMALGRDLIPEDVQLYYQIALLGQADLPLAPDPRTGMEMVLLRMLAFRPGEAVQ